MIKWWPLVGFDIESTGLDLDEARIVSAALTHHFGGCAAAAHASPKAVDRTWLLDAGPIPEAAQLVHGISSEFVARHGQDYRTGYADLRSALEQTWAAGAIVAIYNAVFDLTVLDRQGRALGYPPLRPGMVFDPFVCDRALHPRRGGPRTLAATCQAYGVVAEGAHTADGDAAAVLDLATAMLAENPQLQQLAPAALASTQARWFAEGARRRVDDLAARGRAVPPTFGQWPLRSPDATLLPVQAVTPKVTAAQSRLLAAVRNGQVRCRNGEVVAMLAGKSKARRVNAAATRLLERGLLAHHDSGCAEVEHGLVLTGLGQIAVEVD